MTTIGDSQSVLLNILLTVPAFLIVITIHELSHGVVAYLFGDTTAKDEGRLTLNPIKHLDPLGTIMIIFTSIAGRGIGWAKPVPVNPYRFKNPRRDMLIVSLAGPASNFVLAFILAKGFLLGIDTGSLLGQALFMTIQISVVLGVFNLLPIPPLDGSKIIPALLPMSAQQGWYKFEQYGMLVLLLLVLGVPSVLSAIIFAPADFMLRLAFFPFG